VSMMTIRGLPTHNDFIHANRLNKYAGADMKKKATELAAWSAKAQLKPIAGLCEYMFIWYEPNKRRDPDNIAFAKKFVFDGLIQAGIIKNDGWGNIAGFTDRFIHDPDCKAAYVEVLIHEVKT